MFSYKFKRNKGAEFDDEIIFSALSDLVVKTNGKNKN